MKSIGFPPVLIAGVILSSASRPGREDDIGIGAAGPIVSGEAAAQAGSE